MIVNSYPSNFKNTYKYRFTKTVTGIDRVNF